MWQRATQIDVSKIDTFPSYEHRQVLEMDIAYRQVGKGLPLFCLPPWPSSSAAFTPLMYALQEQVMVIAPDLPGWGGSSTSMKLKPTLENYAKVCHEFISAFGYDKFAILGYSYGGTICQYMVGELDLQPCKQVFVSTLHSGDDMCRANTRQVTWAKRALKYRFPSSLIKEILSAVMLHSRGHAKDRFYSAFKDTQLFQQIYTEDLQADVRAVLKSILSLADVELLDVDVSKCESLVIYADTDPGFIKKESRELAKFLELEPVYLENVDHDHFTFDVNKSADIILNFLLA